MALFSLLPDADHAALYVGCARGAWCIVVHTTYHTAKAALALVIVIIMQDARFTMSNNSTNMTNMEIRSVQLQPRLVGCCLRMLRVGVRVSLAARRASANTTADSSLSTCLPIHLPLRRKHHVAMTRQARGSCGSITHRSRGGGHGRAALVHAHDLALVQLFLGGHDELLLLLLLWASERGHVVS